MFSIPEFSLMPLVVLGCLTIGFVLKSSNFLKDNYNKYIPLILTVAGIFISLWIDGWVATPENVIYGALSGLASTGMHQAFVAIISSEKRG
ncbi:MAG: holin family Hol44 protein [Caudoviricetes sp.]|nr:MAG: holin family Hol44 protein [Caudoviricetes sp.]